MENKDDDDDDDVYPVLDERNISIGHCWNYTDRRKLKYLETHLSQVPLCLPRITHQLPWD
jgi:hypothetical protein